MNRLAFLLLLLAAPLPAAAKPATPPAAATSDSAAQSALVERAVTLMHEGKLAEAVPLLDQVIAAEEKAHAGEKRQIYSASSLAETLIYMTLAATAKKEAVAFGPEWSLALFLKGFALVDLGSADAAGPLFERAVALSPGNSQYLAELGEWHKNRREWDRAYARFKSAEEFAGTVSEERRKPERSRALRGMGFVLIEQGKLDEAEKMFRKCLEIDPNDDGAKGELQYISDQRRSRT
ncbi:MAG: tetratricopeptide repeat protein [Allosphingosinicella sp.]